MWPVGCGSILGSCDHILALIAKDLEGFVEDWDQLREDRAAANATTFIMLNVRLGDAHSIHFPIGSHVGKSHGDVGVAWGHHLFFWVW